MSAHLCVRSHYSLLNGLMSVEDIVLSAKQMGYSHIALTEYNVMYSTLEFYKLCLKHEIKPIFGMEVQFDGYSSLLLARNIKGLQCLHRVAYLLSQNGKIDILDIKDDSDNIILILFSEKGPFEHDINNSENLLVSDSMEFFRKNFNHLYLGISHQESKFFHKSNELLIQLANNIGIKSVALPKVYYKEEKDESIFKAVRAIDSAKTLNDPTLTSEPGRYFLNKDKFRELYDTDLIETIAEIIELCAVDFGSLKARLPHFNTGQDVENAVYLSTLSKVGLNKRLDNVKNDEYLSRLEYELNVLNSMNFTDYFLIVYDIVRYAKNKGIMVGPGRGSAAGSLVAYSLGITDVDPIEYGLIFERFLNPERKSMPDIDIDFPDDRRDEVIAYANMKYGKEHVAHILSFGSLQAKASFKDVGRILNIPLSKVNAANKLIDNFTLLEAYKNSKQFAKMIDTDKSLQACMDLALRLEGKPRHTTLHAAGIVLSEEPILDIAPLIALDEYTNALQYDMSNIEDLGLIKMDILSLKNLTVIDRVVEKIRIFNKDFRIQTIPMDDQNTFSILGQGSTLGIFQLESAGMTNLLVKMKPNRFLDIVDTIALYRPGPMENIPLYLKNRANSKDIAYIHEKLERLTKETFGILIYQEQIMEVAQVFAGFSLGKADILRRAMSKKDSQALMALEKDFIQGSIANGYSEVLAQEIFDLIYKFANYGFNKSHSVAYGLIAYQLAYLKANYSQIFYTELLTSVINDAKKTKLYLDECAKNNVLILSVNLDQSKAYYQLYNDRIRLPLTIIKGISNSTCLSIQRDRDAYGPYNSLIDAIVRLIAIGINTKQIDALISAGALDYFGETREVMHASMERIIMYAQLVSSKDDGGNRVVNYDLVSQPELVLAPSNRKTRLEKEFDVLGFYLSEHPIVALRNKNATHAIGELEVRNEPYRVIASIASLRKIRDKNGNEMAFIEITDDTGNTDAILFSSVFKGVKDELRVGVFVLLMINFSKEDSKIIQKIHIIDKE